MKIIEFLNSEKTYNKVLDILKQKGLDLEKLPDNSFIAGGSVANVLISILHGGEPVINDIDVYIKTDDKNAKVGNVWYPSMYTTEDNVEVLDDDYGRIYISEGGDRMRVVAHRREGILNIIQYAHEKGYKRNGKSSSKTECELTVEGFDLNCCMSAIDLTKGVIVYTENFVDYLKTKQLKVVNPMAPIQTTIRIYKKLQDLGCYCNIEHEIRFLTVAYNKLNGNQLCKYIGPETEVKYKKYHHFVSKYFTIRKPKNSDEVPHSMKDKFFIGTNIDPKCKIWVYDPVINFDIVEQITTALRLKRIWYLNYTPKKKSEQDKINKVFYKNVLTGDMTEDSWGHKEGWPIQITKFHYSSNRYTHTMILAKKDYYKCDFTIKHLNVIDEFTKNHYHIRRILSKLDTVSQQYKMIKFIKNLAKKEGEWVIGLLENVEMVSLLDNYTSEDLVKFINIEKSKDSVILVKPLVLDGFRFTKNITELTSNLDLKIEGTKMGHCVGGYGNQIKDGHSRIFHVDCDGIGSTLEISLPKTTKTDYNIFLDKDNDVITIDEVIRSKKDVGKFIVRYSDDSLKTLTEGDLGHKIRQHQGRYPEKGNLTPTEGNILIVNELIKFLNNRYFLDKFNIDLTESFANPEKTSIFV